MRLLLVLVLSALGGCATPGEERDPRDPWEGVNRGVYKFNDTFDEVLAKPVARTYVKVLHQEIRTRIGNFFSNLADPLIGVNNFLQGKFEDGVNDWARFAFNSTFGLLGIHDVASEWGYEKHNEDFGQTFGRWGAGPGPYLILPLLGSSTVRDGAGTGVDMVLDPMGEVRPINLRNSLIVLRATNLRADLLEASRILEEAALDRYVFQRDAYLQRRRSLVYDGRPPREKLE
jgi:phospholipid-binding lipoprotein MlaA